MAREHNYKKYPELTNKQLEEMPFDSPHIQIKEDFEAEVVKVHDGDTITLKTSFRDFDFPLRFLNIDTAEMNEGGDIARDWLRERILGKTVMIKINTKNRVGKFGRLLGEVISDGINVNEEEIMLGLAKPFDARDEGEIPNFGKIIKAG